MRNQRGTVHQLCVYPIKALCPVIVNEITVSLTEGIKHDREWALMDSDNLYINGKSCPRVHDIRLTSFVPPGKVTLQLLRKDSVQVQEEVSFDLFSQKDLAENWFNKVIGKPLKLVHKKEGIAGFPDDPRFDGPTIVSLNTLKTVEQWFGIKDAAERFRPNIIIDGVNAFWEDTLVDEDTSRGYRITFDSNIDLVAVYPIHRCVVPTRAPSTSAEHGKSFPGFIADFQKHRTENFPENAPVKRLTGAKTNKCYHLCTACVILSSGNISVRNSVSVKYQISLRSAVEKVQPLTKKYIRKLIDNGHSIREISNTKHVLLSILVTILPVSLSAALITATLSDAVRKPTLVEILIGAVQFFIVVVLLWNIFRSMF